MGSPCGVPGSRLLLQWFPPATARRSPFSLHLRPQCLQPGTKSRLPPATSRRTLSLTLPEGWGLSCHCQSNQLLLECQTQVARGPGCKWGLGRRQLEGTCLTWRGSFDQVPADQVPADRRGQCPPILLFLRETFNL